MATTEGFRPDWAQKDFYAELGVKKDATNAEIKKAYRKLARANHPDSNPGDSADSRAKHDKFKAVAEAYDVVGDPEKRTKYDEMRELYGSGGFRGGFGGGGGGFNIEDLLRDRGGAGGGGIGDMFGDLFGGFGRGKTQSQPRPQKGSDVETTATIGFQDALDGVTISLRLTSDAPCPDCNGTGGKPGTKPRICPECEGAGFVVNTVGGAFSLNETCPRCGGRQLIYDEPCPTCHGSGHGLSARSIQARIPAGVKDGQRIRLKGKGSAGVNGGPAGDLYVTVKVSSHRLFGRKGDNLTLDVPISFDEAALGAEIKVPTLGGGPVTLKVPAGTPNGRTFRVRGKGSRKKDGTHGDLLVTVHVQVPGTLNPAAREAVEAYRAAGSEPSLRANLFTEAGS
jgi:molecular chaperone DnaJ